MKKEPAKLYAAVNALGQIVTKGYTRPQYPKGFVSSRNEWAATSPNGYCAHGAPFRVATYVEVLEE